MIDIRLGITKEEKQILQEWVDEKYEEYNGEVSKEELKSYLRSCPELINLLLGHTRR